MTTLAIIPNWKNKSARFKGTVAAGEHVSVTIQNDDGEGEKVIDDASTLRLRVVGMDGRTLAIFPEPVEEGETPEAWGEADLTPLTCTLNLNTVQMLKAVPPAANVPLLWVLDDYENKTLYFKEQFPVEHWPRKFGEEEPTPTDLDDYKDIIEDFNTRLTAAEQTVATAATDAQNAANSALAAASSATTAATAATDAQTGAIASKNAAQTAANDAASAKTAAEDAQDAAEDAQEAAETAQGKAEEAAASAAESAATFVVDDTLSVEGAAADAKAVGEANQDLITQIETVQDNLDNEVAAREELDGAVQVDRQNLAEEIARAQGAEQTLNANKADKSTTYTKTEVDTKIAGVQTFKKYLVQTLPDPDEADMKGLYLVPTGETSEEGDLCEEWTVVEEDGEKRWELIGGTTVDLDDYYTKTETDALVTLTPIYSQTPTFSEWTFESLPEGTTIALSYSESENLWMPEVESDYWSFFGDGIYSSDGANALSLTIGLNHLSESTSVIARRTRTDILGYVLGSQSDKRLASEAEAEALRASVAGKQGALSAQQLANIEAVPGKLDKSGGTMTGALNLGGYALQVNHLSMVNTTPNTTFYGGGEIVMNGESVPGQLNSKTLSFPSKSGILAVTSDIPDATLTERFTAWALSPATMPGGDAYPQPELVDLGEGQWQWKIQTTAGLVDENEEPGTKAAKEAKTSLAFQWAEAVTATRTALSGLQLGSQSGKPLASEAEAEALRAAVAGKQDALSAQQLANIAAVPSKANASDMDVALSQKQDRYTAWTVTKLAPDAPDVTVEWVDGEWAFTSDGVVMTSTGNQNLAATSIEDLVGTYSATRSVIIDGKANRAANPTAGNLAALDANGNLKDSGKTPANFATAEQGGKADAMFSLFEEVPGYDIPAIRLAGFRVPWGVAGYIEFVNGGVHFYHPAAQGEPGVDYTTAWPFKSGTFATTGDIPDVSGKLDSASAAPAFSSDSSVSYPIGSHVTYNGKLYKCTTATTGGTWDASKWAADTMTDPDAVLDISAQNQLRVVAKDGTLLWAQGYDLASTSSATLACDAANNFTFANGATTQAFTLPTAPTGKVGDFGLDIDNSANASAATMTLTGLDTAFSVIVPQGESLNDMLAIAAGELARFYISLSTFRINNLPTWHIVKQIVENGGATV